MRGTLLLVVLVAGCGQGFGDEDVARADSRDATGGFFDSLPAHFPRPIVPADNPMTAAKVALGRHLFHDPRLSGNGTQSCATCHEQARAFTDARATAVGSTGQAHPRNSQTLANVAWNSSFAWGNPSLVELEQQNMVPIVNADPVELGVDDSNREAVLERFRGDALYQRLFAEAFPGEADPWTLDRIVRALASFCRLLVSSRAPFDRWRAGDEAAVSDAAKRGFALFNSDRLECNQCHGGFNFSDGTRTDGGQVPAFHNTGLYNVAFTNSYPAGNQGVYEITKSMGDRGRMRAPTLRNVALTAPYNHDGSTPTLDDVLDNYARGGRLVTSPPARAGDGRANNLKDGEIHGFTLTAEERADLLAFLQSLTDEAFVSDPALSDPFKTCESGC